MAKTILRRLPKVSKRRIRRWAARGFPGQLVGGRLERGSKIYRLGIQSWVPLDAESDFGKLRFPDGRYTTIYSR